MVLYIYMFHITEPEGIEGEIYPKRAEKIQNIDLYMAMGFNIWGYSNYIDPKHSEHVGMVLVDPCS